MPGYRDLSKRYEVGRDSMAEALGVLERRGYVTAAERGGRRKVRLMPSVEKKSRRLLAIRWKQYALDYAEQDTWRKLMHFWEADGGVVDEVLVDMSRKGNVKSRLSKIVEQHGSDAILVESPSSHWAEAMISMGLPTYCRGGSLIGLYQHVAGAAYIINRALEKILLELLALGHARTMCPLPRRSPQLAAAYLRGYQRAFGDAMSDGEIEALCPCFAENDPKVWQSYWRKYLSELNPTAVVCWSMREMLSLYGFCYQAGIRIPQDLSVVCVSDEELAQWVVPVPVMMRHPHRQEYASFKKWMKDGLPEYKWLTLDWVAGESVRAISK